MNMESRQKYLDDLDQFLENCQMKVTQMLDGLGWTPDHFIQPKKIVHCTHNRHHIMSPTTLQQHEPVCQLIQQGCTRKEAEKILDNSDYFYEKASCVYMVKIDKEVLNSVLWNHHVKNHSVYYGHSTMPLTPDQEEQMLSKEDRLGLAEYIICKSREANRIAELEKDELMASANLADLIKTDTAEKRLLDPVEEMAALRDYRRRRQSYRAKNVHITKKSHTEIMREVIDNQMEMYGKQLQDEANMEHRVNKMLESVKEVVEEGEYRESSNTGSRDRTGRSREPVRSYSQSRERSRSRDRDGMQERSRDGTRDRDRTRERSRDKERTRERSKDADSRHYDDDREKTKAKDKRKQKHKKSRSRSRSRERSKSQKKHKKHKHKSRHVNRTDLLGGTSFIDTDSMLSDT